MRRTFKIFAVIIMCIIMFPASAKAEELKKLQTMFYDQPQGISMMEGRDFLGELPPLYVYDEYWRPVSGKFTYPNYDNTRVGVWDLEWVFTPDDPSFETLTGTIKLDVRPKDPVESDEPTSPSLTATTVLLTSDTAYDINLNNKIAGSAYRWTSSDTKVAKVNSKNGLVTAVSEGTATITCEIAQPDGKSQKLQSIVTVGYDDNAPILSDTAIDLEKGDKYTIKVENTLTKSNIRFATSNKSVVKVGTASGKVTAVSAGDAYITCTITAGGQVIVLRCDVTVTE